MTKKHVVTPEEFIANPELGANGIKIGDEIEITDDTNPNAGDTPPADLNPIDLVVPTPLPEPIAKGPVPIKAAIEQQASAIFDAMPHIHTIWFDAQGGWRFYKTPDGTQEINRPTEQTTVNTNDL